MAAAVTASGWAGPDHAGEWGAEWVRFGLQEGALSQTVFATDYPQAVRDTVCDKATSCSPKRTHSAPHSPA